jgi:hypothetical protein
MVPAVPTFEQLVARLTDTQPVLLLVCAWHTSRADLDALSRRYPGQITHGLCPACAAQLELVNPFPERM